jgi:ribonuclease Z
MKITLLGVGEAFDADEPNSAALVHQDGFTLLIDCGTTVVSALWRTLPDPDAVDALYLTHKHLDHVLGVPAALHRWDHDGRRKELLVFATAPMLELVQRLIAQLDAAPDYPVRYEVQPGSIGPFAARYAPMRHSDPVHGIRLDRFIWSGDGRPTPEMLALATDADLMMQECWSPVPCPEKPGHCDLPTARAIAGPKRIGLYHVREGQRPAMKRAAADDPRLFVPDAGEVIEL